MTIRITRINNNETIQCANNNQIQNRYNPDTELINKLLDKKLKITELKFYEFKCECINYRWSENDLYSETIELKYHNDSETWYFCVLPIFTQRHDYIASYFYLDSIAFSDGSAFKFIKEKDGIRLYRNTNNLRSVNSILC